MMAMPLELRSLSSNLLGEWDVYLSGTAPSGNSLNGIGSAIVQEVSLGHGLQVDVKLDITDLGDYEETHLLSFDRFSKSMRLYTVTSNGNVHDHRGHWKDDSTLFIAWEGNKGGSAIMEEITVQLISQNEVRVHTEETVAGKPGANYVLSFFRR
jgi:hypothetical protein